jgi:hypothetical protein
VVLGWPEMGLDAGAGRDVEMGRIVMGYHRRHGRGARDLEARVAHAHSRLSFTYRLEDGAGRNRLRGRRIDRPRLDRRPRRCSRRAGGPGRPRSDQRRPGGVGVAGPEPDRRAHGRLARRQSISQANAFVKPVTVANACSIPEALSHAPAIAKTEAARAKHVRGALEPVGLQLLWRTLDHQPAELVLQLLPLHPQLLDKHQGLRGRVPRRDLQPLGRAVWRVFVPRRRTAASLRVNMSVPTAPPTTTAPQVVMVEGGPVTMLDLATLQSRQSAFQSEADALRSQAASLQSLAGDRWQQTGSVLLQSIDRWSPGPQLTELVQQAVALKRQADASASEAAALRDHQYDGVGGAFGRVRDWRKVRNLASEEARFANELNPLLVALGRQAGDVELPGIAMVRAQAVAADTEAGELIASATASSNDADALLAEVQRRTESQREMGFDAPYLAAYLQTYGPTEVQSPLILKKGEHAQLSQQATLERQQTRRQWVGSSQGFSFPIGHTGIRYRVGGYHGHPVEQQFLAKLDVGTLVITNQRLAFIGNVKSTNTPLSKLLHVECYSDAVAVFQEGRENPDFYLTPQPKYTLFMINWALSRAAQ